jgi:hypothetical protein
MTAISIERYLKLYRPHNCFLKPFRTILGIWAIAIACTVTAMFHFRAFEFFTEDRLIGCRVGYETNIGFFKGHYNYIITLSVGCFVPVAITSIMYYKVIVKIREASISKAVASANGQTSAYSDGQVEAFEESKRQTTKMLILIVVTYFAVCSPLFLMWFIHFFIAHVLPEPCNNSAEEPIYYRLAYLACVTSICLNPFIYCHYNQIFKSEAKSIWNWIKSCGKDAGKSGDEILYESSTYKNSSLAESTATNYSNVWPANVRAKECPELS